MEQIGFKQLQEIMERLVVELQPPYYRHDELVVEQTADPLDQGENAARRDLAARQVELCSMRIRELRAALSRIKNGTYGLCLGCEAEISSKRLVAVPWACYCITCQESADQDGGQPDPSRNAVVSLIAGHRRGAHEAPQET